MAKSTDLINIVDEERAVELQNQETLKTVLNSPVPKQWVKPHPLAKNVQYLPVDKVETMLDTIFQEWRVEVLNIVQLAQSICCTVRLHYRNPISKEWSFHDGVGAVPLKTDKGFSAADLLHIKSDAVQTGAPAAKSFALKDAAEHLGKLFGRDLNRKDTVDGFNGVYSKGKEEEDVKQAVEAMEKCKTMDELRNAFQSLPINIRGNKIVVEKKNELKEKLNEAS